MGDLILTFLIQKLNLAIKKLFFTFHSTVPQEFILLKQQEETDMSCFIQLC